MMQPPPCGAIVVVGDHGSAREIEAAIADELRSSGLIVDVKDVSQVTDLIACDAIVPGSAIYAGSCCPK